MRDKQKKKIELALLLVTAILMAIYLLSLFLTGKYKVIKKGYQITKWYYTLILLSGSFIFYISSHEIMHALLLRVNKVKIKAIIILNLVLVKKKKIFIPFINPFTFPLIGGMVIPELPKIKDYEDFEKIRKAFKKSLISAPLFNFSTFILIVVVFTILLFFNFSYITYYLSLCLVCLYFLLTLIFMKTSFVNKDEIKGDISAYYDMEDNDFLLIYLIYYLFLSKDIYNEFIISCVEKRFLNNNYNKNFISFYLELFLKNPLLCRIDFIKKIIKISLNYYEPLNISEFINNLMAIESLYLLGKCDIAVKEYQKLLLKSHSLHKKDYNYQIKLLEHKIGISNNNKYLSDKKNIRLGFHILFLYIYNYKKEVISNIYKINIFETSKNIPYFLIK